MHDSFINTYKCLLVLVLTMCGVAIFFLLHSVGLYIGIENNSTLAIIGVCTYVLVVFCAVLVSSLIDKKQFNKWHAEQEKVRAERDIDHLLGGYANFKEKEVQDLKAKYLGTNAKV